MTRNSIRPATNTVVTMAGCRLSFLQKENQLLTLQGHSSMCKARQQLNGILSTCLDGFSSTTLKNLSIIYGKAVHSIGTPCITSIHGLQCIKSTQCIAAIHPVYSNSTNSIHDICHQKQAQSTRRDLTNFWLLSESYIILTWSYR